MNWIKKIYRWLFRKKKLPDNENDFKVLQLAAKANLEIVKTTEVEKDKIVEKRYFKKRLGSRSTVVHEDNLSGRYPARSATARENELYAIKPNLQYWVNKGIL